MSQVPPPSQPEPEELAPVDDTIIGKAVRWSLVALLGACAVIGGTIFLLNRKPGPAAAQLTQMTPPALPDKSQAEVPTAKFTDVTRESGITFVHNNGAYGEKLLPETMGGGVAFFDYDNDGHQDLLFVNSTEWPWHPTPTKPLATMALYHNDGKGHFTDVTPGSGLDVSFYAMGVAIGDYDNDGLDDVFITAVGGNHLFHNDGSGKFKEVTPTAMAAIAVGGVGGETNDWSTCAAWIDYDNDGKLDLFVGSYVKWSRQIDAEVGYKIDGRTRAYGQPMNFQGAFPHLYHNEGNGRFTDASIHYVRAMRQIEDRMVAAIKASRDGYTAKVKDMQDQVQLTSTPGFTSVGSLPSSSTTSRGRPK